MTRHMSLLTLSHLSTSQGLLGFCAKRGAAHRASDPSRPLSPTQSPSAREVIAAAQGITVKGAAPLGSGGSQRDAEEARGETWSRFTGSVSNTSFSNKRQRKLVAHPTAGPICAWPALSAACTEASRWPATALSVGEIGVKRGD